MRHLSYLIFLLLLCSCSAPKPYFEIESNNQKYEAPTNLKFVNQSEKAEQYIWDFGDGNTSSSFSPEHRYSASGRYEISLKAIKGNSTKLFKKVIQLVPPKDCLVEIETSLGVIVIKLYENTPLHRDNFIRLAGNGFYEGTLFHRVIKGFMIQGGDPDSKNASEGKRLGSGGPGYTIPSEFSDTLIHTKGALAAARQGDSVNPKKASSGSQFYIVQGRPVPASQLENIELQKGIKYTQQGKEAMLNVGGTPSLDKEYTVFGHVVEGIEIIDKIAESKTDEADRPVIDVKILRVKIIQ